MRRFTDEPLITIVRYVREQLAGGSLSVALEVPDPDLGRGRYAGERVGPQDALVHRSLRSWCDLAEAHGCRLLTPRPIDATHVQLRFERLGEEAPWHRDGQSAEGGSASERYGSASAFARVQKLEEPAFLLPLLEALGKLRLSAGGRVLVLGVNRGDEVDVFSWLPDLPALSFVGIDHSQTAIAEARRRHGSARSRFLVADLNQLPAELGTFSLVLCIGTLQSPGVDDRALLRRLVQEHLEPDAALVLGFPNCRFKDGEVVYGARTVNLREPDLSLLVKDLGFYRRYLHQHRFRTFISGKYDLLLTAVRGAVGPAAERSEASRR